MTIISLGAVFSIEKLGCPGQAIFRELIAFSLISFSSLTAFGVKAAFIKVPSQMVSFIWLLALFVALHGLISPLEVLLQFIFSVEF